MTISQEAAAQAAAFALATPRTGRLTCRASRSDFGEADSYWLKVRRIGRDYPCGSDVRDGDFGVYLGLHDEGYLVALQAIFPPHIIGYERFATLSGLTETWELD